MKGYSIVLTNRRFSLLWLAQLLTQAGLRMYQISLVWWMVSQGQKGSGSEIGLFMVASALPSILFAPRIGRAVDRFPARRVLFICAALAAAGASLSAALLSASRLTFLLTLALGFLVALFQAVMDPTFNKTLQEVVSQEDMESAVALQSAAQPLASFGGALFGASLIDFLNVPKVVALSAFCYILCSLCSTGVSPQFSRPPGRLPEDDRAGAWSILRGVPFLRAVLLGFGLVNFFVTPILVVLPLYTSKALHGSATLLGVLEAGLWIGLLLGSFLSRWVNFVKSTVRLGGCCMLILGISLILPGLMIRSFVMLLALFVSGVALGVNNVKFVTLFQRMVDPSIKGRFFALMQALISFTFPISFFLFGLLGDIFSSPILCLIQGSGIIAIAGFFFNLSRTQEGKNLSIEVSCETPQSLLSAGNL